MRIVAIALVVTLVGGAQTIARPRYRIRTHQVTTGLTFKKIVDRRGPNRIRVLEVDPATRLTLDVALGTEELPGHETTSSMARRHGAIAAINGDFSLRPYTQGSGRPVGTFIEDGELHASSLIWGRNFSISRDETRVQIGHNELRTSLVQTTGEAWDMAGVNPLRYAREGFTLYTPAGGRLMAPPPDSCGARLTPSSPYRWAAANEGVERDFVVDRMVCQQRRIRRAGDYVVTTPRSSFDAFTMQTSLTAGDTLTQSWSIKRAGVLDTIGGNPDLLQNGRVTIGSCTNSYFCGRNPRTGVGVRPDGTILLVTVDGRRKRSVGLTLDGFARLFQWLGARSALNLDGGGSTTMFVRGRIVNVPSDGFQRPVGTALLVLPGPDSGETEPSAYTAPAPQATEPPPTPLPERVAVTDGIQVIPDSCRSLLDPGSTGGMLDAVAKGLLGPRDHIPTPARWGLRVFRGTAVCK